MHGARCAPASRARVWHVAGHRTPCLHALPACKPPGVTQTPREAAARHMAGPMPGAPASQRTSSDWSTSGPSPAAAGSAPHSRQEQRPCPPTKLSKPAARLGGATRGWALPGCWQRGGAGCAALHLWHLRRPGKPLCSPVAPAGAAQQTEQVGWGWLAAPGSAPTFDGNEGRQAAARAPHKRRLQRACALQRGHREAGRASWQKGCSFITGSAGRQVFTVLAHCRTCALRWHPVPPKLQPPGSPALPPPPSSPLRARASSGPAAAS